MQIKLDFLFVCSLLPVIYFLCLAWKKANYLVLYSLFPVVLFFVIYHITENYIKTNNHLFLDNTSIALYKEDNQRLHLSNSVVFVLKTLDFIGLIISFLRALYLVYSRDILCKLSLSDVLL